ncbi:MAG: GIY-YIG nuclease family protein [Chloroflexota bacterium]
MTTEAASITLTGRSGKRYTYQLFSLATTFKAAPGNYFFGKVAAGLVTVLYVGQTSDLDTRFDNHHKRGCAQRHGMTNIGAHLTPGGESVRLAEEADLIAAYNPPCNG